MNIFDGPLEFILKRFHCIISRLCDIQYIEPLIMDTLNKGHNRKHLSIKDTL